MLLQSLLRPVLTPIMRGIFDPAQSVSAAWSPLSLWPDGIATPGMWIDPSLLTASFNDYTGTTPVVTPGTVADSANPVGLSLDIRAGAPDVLGPELVVNGDFSNGATGWTPEGEWTVSGGQASITNASTVYVIYQAGLTPGKTYKATFTVTSISAGRLSFYCGKTYYDAFFTTAGTHTAILVCGANGFLGVGVGANGTTASIDNVSFKEVPGNHMLQSTPAARPLASARANLLTATEDLGNASWQKGGGAGSSVTTTNNYGIAPDGSQTAIRVNMERGSLYVELFQRSAIAVGTTHKLSVWIKSLVGTPTVGVTWSNISYGGVTTLTESWVEYEFDVFPQVSQPAGINFVLWTGLPTTSAAADFLVWHPQLEIGSTVTTYQRVGSTDADYASGPPIAQLYDGTDDGMATAAFTAGTLIDGMDCLIAVRRDSAALVIAGLYETAGSGTRYTGYAESGVSGLCFAGAGAPTVWVDDVQLSGGTSVTGGTLHTALTVGDWHILEFRNLDLSAWTAAAFGRYTGGIFNGARGDILLYPSTASTEDKDAARQYLADYYGVTLP